MLKDERQQLIVRELERKGSVMVDDLVSQHGRSRMTIRRDLYEIEKSNLLKRTHG